MSSHLFQQNPSKLFFFKILNLDLIQLENLKINLEIYDFESFEKRKKYIYQIFTKNHLGIKNKYALQK